MKTTHLYLGALRGDLSTTCIPVLAQLGNTVLDHRAPPLPLGGEAPKLGEVGQASTETLQCKATIRGSPSSRGGASGRRWLSHHKRGWSNLAGLKGGGEIFLPQSILGFFPWLQETGLKMPQADALYH